MSQNDMPVFCDVCPEEQVIKNENFKWKFYSFFL